MTDEFNIIELSDSYKVSQYCILPDDTQSVYSYLESRGGQHPATGFFSLQYMLKKYMAGQVVTSRKLASSKSLFLQHFGNNIINEAGWQYIIDRHNGNLPVEIKAVPEGTIVPTHNVLMTVENTDPKCAWLTNYLETILVQQWAPATVQGNSYFCKQRLLEYLEKTGTPGDIHFKLHDFGFRGVSSIETAKLLGSAHLLNFMGTDTLIALRFLIDHYKADGAVGFSIPATEHSLMTIRGEDGELMQMARLLEKYPTGLVACVSDSYDIMRAVTNYWPSLRDKIMGRDGVLVVRPDSGNPVEILRDVILALMDSFGYEKNEKGYKVLDSHIRTIQGDGINYDSQGEILEEVTNSRNLISVDNFAFGSGGGLLQAFDRDSQRFAFKCCATQYGDTWYDVWKDPITDHGKVSKRGRLKLIKENSTFKTVRQEESGTDILQTVFKNGVLYNELTLDQCRVNANF